MSTYTPAAADAFREGAALVVQYYETLPYHDLRANEYASLARTLKTTPRALERYVSGRFDVTRNPRVIEKLSHLLLDISLLETVDRDLAMEMRCTARTLAGDGFSRLAYQVWRERLAYNAHAHVSWSSKLEEGTHLAAFRSEQGDPVLLTIDGEHRLVAMTIVKAYLIAGEHNLGASLGDLYRGAAAPAGRVCFAPWRGAAGPLAMPMLAIDRDGRLVARLEIPNIDDVDALVAGVQLLRTTLALHGTCDPTEDENDDDV